jgi:hypothetical protein
MPEVNDPLIVPAFVMPPLSVPLTPTDAVLLPAGPMVPPALLVMLTLVFGAVTHVTAPLLL